MATGDHPITGYGSQFMFECSTPYGKSLGVTAEEQKIAEQEADFLKQIEDVTYPAIVPADHYMRLQCLKIAEKQTGLMANEVLPYAQRLYAFVTGKE